MCALNGERNNPGCLCKEEGQGVGCAGFTSVGQCSRIIMWLHVHLGD